MPGSICLMTKRENLHSPRHQQLLRIHINIPPYISLTTNTPFASFSNYVRCKVSLPVPIRLRRAILLNDTFLVKRIVRNNPAYLENPDFSDKSNTSLHLAAILGRFEIIKFLVDYGHDSCNPDISQKDFNSALGISLNTDSSTALHLAAAHGHTDCVDILCSAFPQTINRPDKHGATPLMLAARAANPSSFPQSTSLVPPKQRPRAASNPSSAEDTKIVGILLDYGADCNAADDSGDTALHYASTWGNLKTFRLLVQCGASTLVKNNAGCVPADYALTGQASIYCRSLLSDADRQLLKDSIDEEQTAEILQQKMNLHLKTLPSEPIHFASESNYSPGSLNGTLYSDYGDLPPGSAKAHSIASGGLRLVDDSDREDDMSSTFFNANPPKMDGISEYYDNDSKPLPDPLFSRA
ncbi:hypothetical protein LOZ51_004772 [Ophidiomyces ophidiicola]|nr:hypothetical protein LOZ55_000999 [Ophidiomyces ophidiicola]KAI1983240.1 hypothetical protein LOZ54_005005 [Ophidiomyces ophidiicola]KAI1990421.1 hypothetical protein LOZ51_004772 [Ophidiomyces ophidiicola]